MLTFTILALVTQIVTALAVVSKNYRNAVNYIFGALSFSLGAWAFVNFIAFSDPFAPNILQLMRIVMLLVVLQNSFFFMFARALVQSKSQITNRIRYYLALSLIVSVLAVSPLLFIGVTAGSVGANPVPGPAMPLFLIHAIISVGGGLRYIRRGAKIASGTLRSQRNLIFAASLILWLVVPITNFVVPLLFQSVVFVQLSPIYTMVFSSLIAYAIIKHKFFDIRLVVARSIAYILLLVSFGLIYGFTIFSITSLFLRGEGVTFTLNVIHTLLALVLAFTFQPLKRFFDKVTEKFLYHDAYDSQVLLSDMSELLAEEIDLNVISDGSLRLISNALRPVYARLVVFDDSKVYKYVNIGETPDNTISVSELLKFDEQITLNDELQQNSKQKTRMNTYDVSVAVQLKTKEGVVGYLLMGVKQSGHAYSRQDVKVLSIVASELAIGIENAQAFEKIRDFNETLQQKVKDATAKLRSSNKKLKALDEAKDEFISMASHQLRTPLTTIKGYLSMILEGDMGKISKEQKTVLNNAFTSSQRMVYLISDLLNVSRLNTGKFIIEKTDVDLIKVVADEVASLEQHFAAKNLEYDYIHPEAIPIMQLDEGKLRQVIMNFIDNAIYYTPEGGDIEIRLDVSDKQVEFRVIDSGIGVPKAAQAKLFAKFFRADNAQKVRPDGTGLGLFLARKVVIGHGGAIIFKSKEGEGSTFGFSLPL